MVCCNSAACITDAGAGHKTSIVQFLSKANKRSGLSRECTSLTLTLCLTTAKINKQPAKLGGCLLISSAKNTLFDIND